MYLFDRHMSEVNLLMSILLFENLLEGSCIFLTAAYLLSNKTHTYLRTAIYNSRKLRPGHCWADLLGEVFESGTKALLLAKYLHTAATPALSDSADDLTRVSLPLSYRALSKQGSYRP